MYNYYGINEKLDTELKAVAKKYDNPECFKTEQEWQDYMEDILAYADIPAEDGEWLTEMQSNTIDLYLDTVWDKAQEELAEETYTGDHFVGEIINHRGHECKVTKVWNVYGNGISIIPTGNYGWEIDIYEEQL